MGQQDLRPGVLIRITLYKYKEYCKHSTHICSQQVRKYTLVCCGGQIHIARQVQRERGRWIPTESQVLPQPFQQI